MYINILNFICLQDMPQDICDPPIEAQEIPEYEGPYDGCLPNDNEEEKDMITHFKHNYDLRPKQKRSCSPARHAAPLPKTVPRYNLEFDIK